jgi:hypothetical protein
MSGTLTWGVSRLPDTEPASKVECVGRGSDPRGSQRRQAHQPGWDQELGTVTATIARLRWRGM